MAKTELQEGIKVYKVWFCSLCARFWHEETAKRMVEVIPERCIPS